MLPTHNRDSLKTRSDTESLHGTNGGTTPASLSTPPGVALIAVLFGAAAILALIFAVLTSAHRLPLVSGAFLLGEFAFRGWGAFLVYAILNALCAAGLLALNRVARWLAILLLIWGLVQIVPGISIAIIDQRFRSVLWWGCIIIIRCLALLYLLQPSIREAFSERRLG